MEFNATEPIFIETAIYDEKSFYSRKRLFCQHFFLNRAKCKMYAYVHHSHFNAILFLTFI